MNDKKIALISVSDKLYLDDIAKFLKKNNFEIFSTGGTFKKLKTINIKSTLISDITKFPEIMNGRVKTLHPKIHAGLLARKIDQNILDELKIERISLLVVNFYPFENIINKKKFSFEEAIENIDIGGPAMVRSAAKNYENCCVLTDPDDYKKFMDNFDQNKKLDISFNKIMTLKAFQKIAIYDISIANYLDKEICGESFPKFYAFEKLSNLRYGENPHQKASLYQDRKERCTSVVNSMQYQGKEMSYNNIVDGDTALSCVISFNEPTCVIVKHANPCGVSSSINLIEAYERAYESDPLSAFGGVIAFNVHVDEFLIKKILEKQFVELIIAPSFSKKSLEIAKEKINIRIIEFHNYEKEINFKYNEIKNIRDGILIQDSDSSNEDVIKNYKVVTKKKPTNEEFLDLNFAWIVSKFVKSNAIVFSKDRRTLGIGAGQMSRIDSTFIASQKAQQLNLNLKGAVMASDAFFPFSDNIEKASQLGISSIIQPGGSQNDQKVIDIANELNISLVFTGIRHFRH